MGMLFVESLRRLYREGKLSGEKIVELANDGKITEEEKKYILAL